MKTQKADYGGRDMEHIKSVGTRGGECSYLRGAQSEDWRETVESIVCVLNTVLQTAIYTALCFDTLPTLNLVRRNGTQ